MTPYRKRLIHVISNGCLGSSRSGENIRRLARFQKFRCCDKEPRQIFENLRTKLRSSRLLIVKGKTRHTFRRIAVDEMTSSSASPIVLDSQRSNGMCNSQPTRLNVLVAEDGLLNQRFAVRLLEGAGHTVTLVCNGAEALEALRHNDFDLVLMDVEMPEMDGIAAAQAIRADEEEGTRIPIVAVTATGDRETCLRAGMDDWLPKPLSLAR